MDANPLSNLAVPAAPDASRTVSPLKALTGLLLLLPLVLVPVIALWYAGPDVLEAHAVVDRYVRTEAVVVFSDVRQEPAVPVASYTPQVLFRYTVAGRTYESDRLTPRVVGGTQRWARRRAAAYRPGDRVTAWYDPQDPNHAFLERRGTRALTATFFLPAPLLALVFWMAASARTRLLARRKEAATAQA